MLQALTPGKPLAVILNSSGRDTVTPGDSFELGVTVSNRGSRSAVINVFLDDLSPVLRPWCKAVQEYLALAPDQSGEVFFSFQVPPEALPGLLGYVLIVDSPQHYPEYPPARYNLQLQVLPSDTTSLEANDPTFAVAPFTAPDAPAAIAPGGVLQIQVQVYNRSERVDRFRLACTDLPNDWFSITYPQDTRGLGLIVQTDSLGLNPGDRGEILLAVTPPADAIAGSYVPTLRLYSENNPELGLLAMVYLQVSPIYLLQTELKTLVGQVRHQPARFELQFVNNGNLQRDLLLQASSLDEAGLCDYTLSADAVTLAPWQTAYIELRGQPQRWWRRPFFGLGRILNFRVDISDRQQFPLPQSSLQGYLTWLARPWWQLLLLVLAGLGILATLIWLIWWLFFRPPTTPKILEFLAEDARYSALNQDIARVGWQIEHPERVRSLKITGYSPEGTLISGPLTYDFSQGLPITLAAFCDQDKVILTCRNVRTDARQPGEYVFELTIVPGGRLRRQIESQRTSNVVIDAVPLPSVLELVAGQTLYREIGSQPVANDPRPEQQAPAVTLEGVQLNWVVTNPKQLQALLLTVRNSEDTVLGGRRYPLRNSESGALELPEALQNRCQIGNVLVCRDVPTGIFQVGDYTFELVAVPLGSVGADLNQELEPQQTEPIKIAPRSPRLVSFQINGQEAAPKYLLPIDQGQPVPVITVTWQVDGGQTTTVDLQPSPGTVPLRGGVRYPLGTEPGTTMLILQVSNGVDEPIKRSVVIQTFDPTPSDPAAEAAAAAAAAIANSQQQQQAGSSGSGSGRGADETPPCPPGSRGTHPQSI
ncbi:MAG: transcriptional regulator, partial [Leptolyngbyaceae cyanobacterium SM1_1_3]|nr:transcriptional regulator [Leptolyngbyaceae cyanobacterium SM1_1_3]